MIKLVEWSTPSEKDLVVYYEYLLRKGLIKKNPPRNRALLVYCPEWSDIGYEVAVWNGSNFETDLHGEKIHDYVKKWCLIYEAD